MVQIVQKHISVRVMKGSSSVSLSLGDDTKETSVK
jgi:hypothetical protein